MLTSIDVNKTIESALAAMSHSLQASPDEALALQADGLAASERIQSWLGLETGDGVALTRDEFRRRLEAAKAACAGRAVAMRLHDASERLERLVLGSL